MKWLTRLQASLIAIILFQINSITSAQVDKAYQHLYNIMDQYHKTIDVFTDKDAGGNCYYPSIIGDYNSISLINNGQDHDSGWSCLEIDYLPQALSEVNWAGIQWLFPDKNWGNKQGRNLSGSNRLSFFAKGKLGGEKVEFKLGGTNRQPYYDSSLPYQDSYDQLSTGILTLTNNWQEYNIDLIDTNYFSVYYDGNSGSNNRYYPSGWYNGDFNTIVDPDFSENPHSGNSCMRVEWNGFRGKDGWKWNGVLWQFPNGNWGEKNGYDLTGAEKLIFWVKTDKNNLGLKIKFFTGIKGIDSYGEIPDEDWWFELDTIWTKYEIDLKGKNLSNIRGGFGFVFNDENDPDPDGCVFYLDDIHFDLPLSKDLSNVIGGFICSVSQSDNPSGCTFYLDNISYKLSEEAEKSQLETPHFLQSYVPTIDPGDSIFYNTAYVYDNALAMLAFMVGGTEEDWKRAETIGRTFIYCQQHDPDFKNQYVDFRLRNAYRAGELVDPMNGDALLPVIYQESDANTNTGNMAWAMIAMLMYYEHNNNASDFLVSAIRMGDWIYKHIDLERLKGFYGGMEGYGHSRVLWKSIEHNIDVYAAFMRLYTITNEKKWWDSAMNAKLFIEQMWNSEDNYFWIGTVGSDIIDKSTLVEDAQSWSNIALKDSKYIMTVNWADKNLKASADGFNGFDFNNDLDGIWFEGTAHMALAYLLYDDKPNYEFYVNQLQQAQANAANNNGLGVVASSRDGLSTGLGWNYFNRLHIGATAWYIFADRKWNPYWDETISPIVSVEQPFVASDGIPASFQLFQNFPNPFNPSTKFCFSLPRADKISLRIYSITGQVVRTLFDSFKQTGVHQIEWDGRDDYNNLVSTGVYLIQLQNSTDLRYGKIVLVK